MRFADPLALLLLLLLPLLVWHLRRRRPAATIGFPAAAGLATLPVSPATRLHRALPWFRLLALALAVVALARPQWGVESTRVSREGITIAMVIDISSSMSALDLQIEGEQSNRLDAVKAVFRDFVAGGDGLEGRSGDAIGMVTFARFADTISPPTLDHDALLALLERVDLVEIPTEDGTAIGDAIGRGVEMLRETGGASKAMILLTDGSANVGEIEPLVAAQLAQALDVRIYTIGAGTRGVALMPVPAADGGTDYQPTSVSIDEETLRRIAELTDASYFRATDGDALREVYAEIDRLETQQNVAEHYQRYVDGYPLVVGLVLALLLLEAGLASTRLRAIP